MNNFEIETIEYSNGITEYIPYIRVLSKNGLLEMVKLSKVVINTTYGKYPKFYTWEDAKAFIDKHKDVSVCIRVSRFSTEIDDPISKPVILTEANSIDDVPKEEENKQEIDTAKVDYVKQFKSIIDGADEIAKSRTFSFLDTLNSKELETPNVKIEYNPLNKIENLQDSSNNDLYEKHLLQFVNKVNSNTEDKKDLIVKEDMICPVTGKHCDDECCTVGSECNIGSDEIVTDPSDTIQDEDYKFVVNKLPTHYNILSLSVSNGIRCKSDEGITNNLDWESIVSSFMLHFGNRFSEIYHFTNHNHKDFIIYFKK